jgi:hypothetical protein
MKKLHIAFIIALLLALSVFFVDALGYPNRARVLPMIIIILAVILLIGQLGKTLRTGDSAGSENDISIEAADASTPKRHPLTPLLVPAWIALLALFVWLLGLVIALPLFTFMYIKMQGERWMWAISLSLLMLAVVYIGFGYLLGVVLYEGLIFS